MSVIKNSRLSSLAIRSRSPILRCFSQKTEEWKACSNLPLSLSWSSLRTRMEGATESKSQFPNFGGIVKHTDDGQTNIRQAQCTTPLGKMMEDKQMNINSEGNYMVSLDPNTSMWQHLDNSGDKSNITPERKAEILTSIQQFYAKRCEADQKTKDQTASNANEEQGGGAAGGGAGSRLSLYSQIARRTPTRYMMPPNAYQNQNQDDDDYLGPNQRSSRHSAGNPGDNQKTYGRRYSMPEQGGYDMRRQTDRMIDTRFQKRPIQQLAKSDHNVNVIVRRGAAGRSSFRRMKDEIGQDDFHKQEMKEFAVYDDSAPYASPIYSSNRASDDAGSSRQKSDKHSNKKHGESDDYDYMGGSLYSAVTPPEPLFKPSSGIASAKMKFSNDQFTRKNL